MNLCILPPASKKILTLGAKGDPPPHPKALQLQKMIRYSATLFVQVREEERHRYYKYFSPPPMCSIGGWQCDIAGFERCLCNNFLKVEPESETSHSHKRLATCTQAVVYFRTLMEQIGPRLQVK